MTDETGIERFALYPLQSGCKAEIGRNGTIGTFLESQGVGPYLEWSRRYGELYRRIVGLLERLAVQGQVDDAAGAFQGDPPVDSGSPESDQGMDRAPLSLWQDIEASLTEYCAANGRAVPGGTNDAIALHLQAIEKWLDNLESRNVEIQSDPEGTKEK